MKISIFSIVFCCVFAACGLRAQNTALTSEGDKLVEEGNINEAIAAYKKQIKNPQSLREVSYHLAAAYAKNSQHDSAFKYLGIAVEHHLSEDALTDPDFLWLRRNSQWPDFEKKLTDRLKIKYAGQIKDFSLAVKLWELNARDQAYFYEAELAEKKLGNDSPVVQALWNAKDDLNQKSIKELDSIVLVKGWPKISEVGQSGANAAFLVIQHSTLELQQKYLPTIKALCATKEASWARYALMYDRVQVLQKKPQLYGSQLNYNPATQKFELFPIEDEKNVDQRRAEMSLGPIAEYVSRWGIKYEPVK